MKYLSLTMLNWFNVVTHYFILSLYTKVTNYMLLLFVNALQISNYNCLQCVKFILAIV